MLKVAFRVDASNRIGTGHLIRCTVLAEAVRDIGAEVFFITNDSEGYTSQMLQKHGFRFYLISASNWAADAEETRRLLESEGCDAQWLIVDHYGWDHRGENRVKDCVGKIIIIDDLANRRHEGDLIIDSTFGEDGTRYCGLISGHCHGLFGSKYVLLKSEFRKERACIRSNARTWDRRHIHLFFGGMDTRNHTVRFSKLLLESLSDIEITAVVSKAYRYPKDLMSLQRSYETRFRFQQDVQNMASTMLPCNMAVGAPGTTTWERACMGLVGAYLSISQNQIPILKRLKESGFCEYFGSAETITENEFLNQFRKFVMETGQLSRMRDLSFQAVDGRGTERVVDYLLNHLGN
ncbi:MAG: UDP-2,4-diacetamido-2,4,6-trideoxy-beta-L-altropyranose hydrolase [Candidatus Omnitrophica bacterium]|nr:UDP-2,4-diacetamido-2,4,6-trideoxy-beta-L-altropyranose hydrolase [Candidatus Omnitrophota bacterium]